MHWMSTSTAKMQSTTRFTHERGSCNISASEIGSRIHTSNGVTVAVKIMANEVVMSHRAMNLDCGSRVPLRFFFSCRRIAAVCSATSSSILPSALPTTISFFML